MEETRVSLCHLAKRKNSNGRPRFIFCQICLGFTWPETKWRQQKQRHYGEDHISACVGLELTLLLVLVGIKHILLRHRQTPTPSEVGLYEYARRAILPRFIGDTGHRPSKPQWRQLARRTCAALNNVTNFTCGDVAFSDCWTCC